MLMHSWSHVDNLLLRHPCIKCSEGEYSGVISNFILGKFENNLKGPVCENLVHYNQTGNSFEESLRLFIDEQLHAEDEIKLYEALAIGISSLQLFVQINWTGPQENTKYDPPFRFLRKNVTTNEDYSESEWIDKLTNELALDGEAISPNIDCLELLLVARAILTAPSLQGIISAKWWLVRCLFTHQQVLEERSPFLYSQMNGLLEQLFVCEDLSASSDLLAQLQLEAASLWLHYGHVGKAEQAIRSSHKLLGLEINLVGALGKRTKHQERELAQLTLDVNVNRDSDINTDMTPPEHSHFPKDIRLEDDVRLSQIQFSEERIDQFPPLNGTEQAAILAACMHRQKSQPKDRLQFEEIMPYLTCLTSQPKVWALQLSALLLRSKLDSEHRRTVERALMQFQTLTESIKSEEPGPLCRLAWVYCSYLPPAWKVESLLAHTYVSLGMVQTALDLFLSLSLWEEVIACYNFLKLRHKAAEIIRQELEKKQTVKLLCLLGDATDDVDCYRQAWELSGEKSGRAQRHWALYYFNRKQYAESIPHLEKSLSINSLQESLWFRLGYAALDQENWTLCATAYRRYCSLEPESFEAWNNLAKAYVKLGQKARAFRALQEAVKCNYENWRVWDNLMAVSTDCGQFEEVIRCYHRILDLNEKHVDVEVLKILTNVIVQGLVDPKECSIDKLRKHSLTLFGRLTAQVLNNPTLWQLYAQLAASAEPSPENRMKVAQCLQKSYRAATQGTWSQDSTTCLEVVDLCLDLAKAYIHCSNQCGSSNEKLQMLSSAKLPLKSVLTKIEKDQRDLVSNELPDILNSRFKELQDLYQIMISDIESLQAT